MEKKIIEFNKTQRALKDEQKFHSGDVVKVFLRIKEGTKERTQLFEGLVIAVKGGQSSSPTITVRKVTHDVGVEMIIPVGSKNVEKIELVKRAKVRRAKLYYVRTLTTKQSRMKYKDIKDVNKKDKPKAGVAKKEEEVAVVEKVEEKVEEKKA
ncbi:MAG: 50S ribosomal protein L19 [Candidatus Moraniibacteriota bacterium]